MENLGTLLVRADASPRMGTGHVMRCLALAQAWQDAGGQAVFVMAAGTPSPIQARLTHEGFRVQLLPATPGGDEDVARTTDLAGATGARWVVLDGYHFGASYQRQIKASGLRLLAIDDNAHAEHYWADLVLNQNLHADESLYRNREPCTRLLLGTRFALLRREFRRAQGRRIVPAVGRKLLVTLGGSDPDGVMFKVLTALEQVDLPGLEVIAVIGGSNPHRAALEQAARACRARVSIQADVTDMASLMAWADAAVAAGGTTTWERALLGLPGLVFVLADNQREISAAVQRLGLGWDLGPHQDVSVPALALAISRLMRDQAARAAMAERGPALVDGQGVLRVMGMLVEGFIGLRPVTEADCRLLWEWANDPVTRQNSFTTDAIPWEKHQSWFRSKLQDPSCALFVALDREGAPIGQVRFDRQEDQAIISVSIAAAFRGRGYGARVIRQAVREVFARWPVQTVRACIREENQASLRTFLKAGFTPLEMTEVRGLPAHQLISQRT